MSEEKPLHVRVAEALGCSPVFVPNGDYSWYNCGCPHPWPHGLSAEMAGSGNAGALLEYDTDWSATGPLIEKYGISTWPTHSAIPPVEHPWGAEIMPRGGETGFGWRTGETPLVAVCNLILALKEAGKL